MEERVFTLTEYITTCSFVHVCEAFKNEFPDSREPSYSTILRLFQKFFNTDSVRDRTLIAFGQPSIVTASAIALMMLLAYQQEVVHSL